MSEMGKRTRSNFAVDVREWIEEGLKTRKGLFSKAVATTEELSLVASGWFRRKISVETIGKVMKEINDASQDGKPEFYRTKGWGLCGRSTGVWMLRNPEGYERWTEIPATEELEEKYGGRASSWQMIAEHYLFKECSRRWN